MKRFLTWYYSRTDLYRLRVIALLALFALAAVPSIVALLGGESFYGLLLNFGTEMAGALVTFLVFDRLIGRYEKIEREGLEQEKLKADLIARLGSRVNEVAIAAAEELRRHGWLEDRTLQEISLISANLEQAQLQHAHLRKSKLTLATLRGANLIHADLQSANMWFVNARESFLTGANLQGVDLLGADLQGAHIEGALFDKYTTLPDGFRWTPDTDMARFTDPDHPGFWRSDNPASPAYRALEDAPTDE